MLNDVITNYLPVIQLGAVGAAVAMCVRVAVQSWQDAVKLDQEERSFTQRLLEPVLTKVGPRSEIAVRQVRMQLVMAGLRDDAALRRYNMLRLMSMGAAMGAIVLLQILEFDLAHTLIVGALLGFCGYKFPDTWLSGLVKARQARIAAALPTVIDLMVLCLDVGLSVEAAFERVTMEMKSMEPLMAEEATLMVGEISAGLTFPTALRRMADRIGLEELITLARLIGQANTLGASIATALREYSEASFTKRMLGLEERAGKISSAMVLPVTVCMLPATMIALVGPAIILVVATAKGM
ncbi:MAG TPA: type II secretion system F family protein [Myxococcota bacterium]|nr:type II secretion system F family protein [Myxococcota bacterium]